MRKSLYPYEYISDWEKFNETLPEKKDFYSHLNMGDTTYAYYAKKDFKDFKIKNLREYHIYMLNAMYYY